jgi:hypothetical protein
MANSGLLRGAASKSNVRGSCHKAYQIARIFARYDLILKLFNPLEFQEK